MDIGECVCRHKNEKLKDPGVYLDLCQAPVMIATGLV